MIDKIKKNIPKNKAARIFVGVLLIICGILGFLPVLGFWMIPLGFLVLSADFPSVRRFRRRYEIKIGRWLQRRKENKKKWGTGVGNMTTGLKVNYTDVADAAKRLQGTVIKTPLMENPRLNELVGGRILIKPECLQKTGSFKFRGAYNRLSQLSDEEKKRGVVAFSSGNHAQGVAYAAKLLDVPATIVMPADAPKLKMDNTKEYGATVVTYDRYTESREEIAADIAEQKGLVVVPSYNDAYIVAGQGTMGFEISEQLGDLGLIPDNILINCGGGGLASGSFTALKHHFPDVNGFIVEPDTYADGKISLETDTITQADVTQHSICDALLSPSLAEITFNILKSNEIQGLSVSDEDALKAVSYAARELKLTGEPGGCVSLAAVLTGKIDVKDKTTVVVISGGNIDPAMLQDALAKYPL